MYVQTNTNSQKSKELSERGLILDKLEVVSQATGLGGKFLVRFEPREKGAELKSGNKFQPGSVALSLLILRGYCRN